jgi:alpha-galactosidase
VRIDQRTQEIVHLSGQWANECQVQRMPLAQTSLLLESRFGKSGFQYQPYVALRAPDTTYICQLACPGNWQLQVRRTATGPITVAGGLNEWGFRHRLRPGDELDLPEALLVSVTGDLNTATQRLHDYRRRWVRPDSDRLVPVQFNTWFGYGPDVHVDRMKAAATGAAELGSEVFVLDSGWFTTETDTPVADWWWTMAGDWKVNPALFPNGLQELSSHCQELGMGFGIWFEAEAVGRDAQIRETHPEWLHAIGGRVTAPEERAILNLGVPAAREWIRERILSVLQSTGATWLKWDHNTNLYQGGWAPGLPEDLTHQDPLVAHYEGKHQLQDELRAALPGLSHENCAGGGSRFDARSMAYAHTASFTDAVQALPHLAIRFGSQLAHPAIEASCWLADWPPRSWPNHHKTGTIDERGDLPFRARVSMMGSMCVGVDLDQWTATDRAILQEHLAWYKRDVRPVLHTGDQYFLTEAPPLDGNGDWAAAWYASKDAQRGVLFAFRLAGAQDQRCFPLPGLDRQARYRLRAPEGWTEVRKGAELEEGLDVTLADPFQSALIVVEPV